MDTIQCSCGGTFQFLGPEHIRIGKVERLGDRDWNEQSIPGQLYVCDRCRCLRFCADADWLQERQAWWAEECGNFQQMSQYQSERFQAFLKDFAEYSDQRLERIAAHSFFSGYDQVAKAAARQLLEERKTNPDAAPQQREYVRPEPESHPSWSRRKNSKPPWEG